MGRPEARTFHKLGCGVVAAGALESHPFQLVSVPGQWGSGLPIAACLGVFAKPPGLLTARILRRLRPEGEFRGPHRDAPPRRSVPPQGEASRVIMSDPIGVEAAEARRNRSHMLLHVSGLVELRADEMSSIHTATHLLMHVLLQTARAQRMAESVERASKTSPN